MRIDGKKEIEEGMRVSPPAIQFDLNRKSSYLYVRVAMLAALATSFVAFPSEALALNGLGHPEMRPRWAIDDTKWFTLGAGFRGSGVWVENKDTGNFQDNFSIDNARVFLNGQIHRYIKFESYTECIFCNNTDPGDSPKMSYNILAAIGKVEINRYVNIWGGRMQIPTERGELSGPFHQATHDAFKTPFFPQDFSTKFGSGGAGRYGHDDGGTFWGSVEPGFIKGTLGYAGGVYRGLQSSTPMHMGPNQGNSVALAGRLTYNFLNPEKNPGYYNRSTYFGKAGDILALAVGVSYQKDGAGSFANRSNFLGLVGDILFEKVLPKNRGVFTVNGEYKQFYANYSPAAFADPDCFCIFDGKSWTVTGLYLIPVTVGIGQFQPYGRFTSIQPDHSSKREEIEAGVNYIIDDFNMRIAAYYQHGDLRTKGSNYAPDVVGDKVDVFKLSFQLMM